MCKWFKSELQSVVSAEYTGVEVTLGSIERRAEARASHKLCKWFESALQSVVSAGYTGVKVTLGSIERRAEVRGSHKQSVSGLNLNFSRWCLLSIRESRSRWAASNAGLR